MQDLALVRPAPGCCFYCKSPFSIDEPCLEWLVWWHAYRRSDKPGPDAKVDTGGGVSYCQACYQKIEFGIFVFGTRGVFAGKHLAKYACDACHQKIRPLQIYHFIRCNLIMPVLGGYVKELPISDVKICKPCGQSLSIDTVRLATLEDQE